MLNEKQVFIKDGFLNLKISIEGLMNGLKYSEGNYIITDKEAFTLWLSKNCIEIGYNDENGYTIWDELLDSIGNKAYENGEEFICMEEELEE